MPLAMPTAEDCEFEARVRLELERRIAVMPAMVHSIDDGGRLLSVSDAWLAKLGYARDEVIGRPSSDFLTAESREHAVRDVLPEFFHTGRCENVQYQMVRKDGGVIDVLVSADLHGDPATGGRASLAVITDVTALKQTKRQLAESETRYRFLTENTSDMIALLGRDGTRLFVSEASRALTGFTPQEMVAMRTADSTHPDDTARVVAFLSNMVGQATIAFRLLRKDGSYVWVESACKPVEIDGRNDRFLIIVRDIDERVRAEQRLHDSEARYRFLAENSTDLILLVGRDGKRIYASPACRTMLGYEPEEMLAIRTADAIHPDDAARVLAMLANGSEDRRRTDYSLSYRMRRKDGSYVWVETAGRAVDIAGRSDQRLVIVREIEQRIAAEQHLKDSEARYRLLADNSTDMVFVLDQDLVRRYVSPACRELLGYAPEEMIGVKPVNMAHPDDAPRLALVFQTLLGGGAERQSIINRIRHRSGRWIWVEAQFRTLRDADSGRITGIIGALRDISTRKAVEDELAEANRRLQALAGQDSLTGLANRRAFDEALAKEYRRAERDKKTLSLVILDVDRFKAFNDHYGHPAGDACLRQIGAAIAETARRPGDVAARYGGEEFVMLLPDTDEAGAESIAERIRRAVLALEIPHLANAYGLVTVSVGVAALALTGGDGSPDGLVEDADRALYCAKQCGRNAVVRASTTASRPPASAVA